MTELTGLRGILFLGPLVTHWCSAEHPLRKLLPMFDAVTFFFVLSGFLITRILLDCRRRAEAAPQARGRLLRRFFIRRGLRIIPAYYATLGATVLLAVPGMIDQLPWNLAYLSNFYYLQHPDLSLGSHFWALAIQEQFYILWALAVFFLPRKRLGPLLAVLIALAVGLRVAAHSGGPSYLELLPFACFDSFGLGALLGLAGAPFPAAGGAGGSHPLTRLGLRVGLPAYAAVLVARVAGELFGLPYAALYPFHRLIAAFAFLWLVDAAGRGLTGPVGRALKSPALIYLGTISYGIYVLHPFTAPFMRLAIDRFGLGEAFLKPTYWFSVKFAGTLALATLSWYLLERPIHRLKLRFPYR